MAKPLFKRPFATHYFMHHTDPLSFIESKGASSTEEGAIRGAIVRIFMGQYQKAHIIDRRTGVVVYNIRIVAGAIKVNYGSGVPFKVWKKPRRKHPLTQQRNAS